MFLVWENLSVELQNGVRSNDSRTKFLLTHLTGFAQPGRIMAVMGPSGSGKSTLLDSLAGRLSSNVRMTGKVLINGKQRSIDCKDVSYVTQEDIFLGTLTVRETLTYSAHMRLSSTMNKEEIENVVEKTIMEMGLEDCANTKIGNWHMRGISTGEKKRLSIGIEILTHPHIMFLDEPTSGLDSAAAFFVIQALANIASDGKIVICSIHQPSSDVFNMFDDLLLLSNGETVYFGEAQMAFKFFAEAGFPCPPKRNPSDHYLRCISVDFDRITETILRSQYLSRNLESSDTVAATKTTEIRAKLIEEYKSSEFSVQTRNRIQEIEAIEKVVLQTKQERKSYYKWKQLCILSRRSFVNMYRDIGYYWLRIGLYVLVGIAIGTLYFNVGKDNGAILSRGKVVCFIYGFMICLSSGGLPFFIEEMKIFRRERLSGHHGEALFVLSNLISSFPFLVIISVFSGTIIYLMVKFHPGFSHYSFFCINLFCCISVIESCMMLVASLTSNVLMGIGVGVGVIVFMMMGSEISRPLPDLPKIFWRYPMSYISFATWAIQGQFKNELIGLEFEPLVAGNPKLKGEEALKTIFGVPDGHSKWWDLCALVCLLVVQRLLFYIIIKYKKRAISSIYPREQTQRTCNWFSKRGLYARKDNKVLHPLSP